MSDLAVGQTVRLPDGRTGIVRFVGNTHFASGDWVGVELEDDSGKNDGSVQGERYFDCSMGHGMFVRPTTLVVTAQAPAAAPKPARRPSRPSSFNPGTGRAATDTGMTKRMSLNAPSPSPGPKASRPSSALRVSAPPVWIQGREAMNNNECAVTHQVAHETARLSSFEYCAVANQHPFQYPHNDRRSESTTGRRSISHIHGTPSDARGQNHAAALDIFSTDKADPGETEQWPAFHDWTNAYVCQEAIRGFGRCEERSGQRGRRLDVAQQRWRNQSRESQDESSGEAHIRLGGNHAHELDEASDDRPFYDKCYSCEQRNRGSESQAEGAREKKIGR